VIVVHTKPACVQCDAVKRYLDRYGIEFQEVSLTPESTAAFQARGILAAPVVELPGEPPAAGRLAGEERTEVGVGLAQGALRGLQ
jgi:glutaredoxin-like protein NrdH